MRNIFFVAATAATALVMLDGSSSAQTMPDAIPAPTNVVIHSSGNTYSAQVDAAGKLQVGEASPIQFFHTRLGEVQSSIGCTALVPPPPSGRSLDVQQVRVDVYTDPATGLGQALNIATDSSCFEIVGEVTPGSVGTYSITFGPGQIATSGLYVRAVGKVAADVYADGFYIPSRAAPANNFRAMNNTRPADGH
jgi:hypothetical protein